MGRFIQSEDRTQQTNVSPVASMITSAKTIQRATFLSRGWNSGGTSVVYAGRDALFGPVRSDYPCIFPVFREFGAETLSLRTAHTTKLLLDFSSTPGLRRNRRPTRMTGGRRPGGAFAGSGWLAHSRPR